MVEVSESPLKPVNTQTIVAQAEQWNTGLITKEHQIVSRFYKSFKYGYPTPFLGRDQLCDPIFALLEKYDIFSRGRFGAWKYEVSNQDHTFMQGVEVVDRILMGTPENTFEAPSLVNSKRDGGHRTPLHSGGRI